MFAKVLIANRGAIACRIIRTLRRMGIASVSVYSDADAGSRHVSEADEALPIGPADVEHSYLNAEAVLDAARRSGADAIHPGYGFLSENAAFAERCDAAQITFIGPTAANIRMFGLKHSARAIARAERVPLLPGSDLLRDVPAALAAAEAVGFPVMLKATAGGGGIGLRVCEDAGGVAQAFLAVARLASSNFRDAGVFLERFVRRARHIEVQLFGDGSGRVVALGERDCSLQRRHQKVIEETPAPGLPATTRAALIAAAVRLGQAVRYRSAGTVEFLYDADRDEFFFLEVNTRLQVEHGVTEQVTGVDLVEWMVRGAAGDFSGLEAWSGAAHGASIQARIYAESPTQDFRPSSGVLTAVQFPADARVDTWVEAGTGISSHYDPLLAKLIVTAPDRPAAVRALQRALDATRLSGLETNVDWLRQVVRSEVFNSGELSTNAVDTIAYEPRTVRVLSGGLSTTIQDYPGRLGYWDVGVPPSGPMDSLAFRLGNRLLGNPEAAAGLEVTALGPALLFTGAAVVCLAGADVAARLDGTALEPYSPAVVAAGQTLKLGRVLGPGMRAYLLFKGGLDVPLYLGSRSTFALGVFGGHAGRPLAAGDVLRLCETGDTPVGAPLPVARRPKFTRDWILRVLSGPHGAPEFFTEDDIAAVCGSPWRVHYNSNRTGVRLVGPKPRWARQDGGEAGLHPSNIHDNAYAIGAIDFTGDMPIVLGPDGPSLGGFVCPFVVIHADLWKTGQLAPGDTVHLEVVDDAAAIAAERTQDELVRSLGASSAPRASRMATVPSAILGRMAAQGPRPEVVYRRQGDRHLLVEYGPMVLDLELRLRVHALLLDLKQLQLPGVIDITPGIRSLQVHYDQREVPQARLLQELAAAEERLGSLDDFEIPSRIVHLPLSWLDPAVDETIRKYMASVRDDAPWCPDNVEFIRRVNGLGSADEVQRIVFDARYLVLGLGDVYLGAPVATPMDPRHRLVTTKYNPARTWTPPNVVGIGGAYLCIYGMEGPGGYQLFGRTIQVWNTYRATRAFIDGKPWLLRCFDQIRFFPVSHAELREWRRDFPLGRRDIAIDHEVFRLAEYRRFLATNRASIETFESKRRAAFDAERADWERRHEFTRVETLAEVLPSPAAVAALEVPAGAELVEAPLGGNVWKVHVRNGDRVLKGSVIAAIEAMKMECDVHSPVTGIVRAVYIQDRQAVAPGAPLIALEPAA
ncbi:MAG TPA: urea carboxylase [Steroidobacteraceae bacterium]|nr:urea carboxylase [Steroidobacteraceae bacterium]